MCENDLIYIRQSGFRSKHSTETALIKIIDDLLFNLDNDRVSGMVLVDYRKAFDMIDHTLLLKKLEMYGISRESLQWLTSYLKDRRQLVKLGDKQSSVTIVRHGIPQGSILGPLLFIVFINDLPLYVTSSRIDLCADDTTLTSSTNYSSIGRLEGTLSTSIAEIVDWAASKSINSASINCFFGPTTASKFHLMQQLEWLLLVYYLTMTRARRRHHVFLH